MKTYQKPDAEVLKFDALESVMDIPGMGGGVGEGDGSIPVESE